MRKLTIYLIIFIVVSGCNSSQPLMNLLAKSEYSKRERQDLIKLVTFFESQISIEGKSKKEAYEQIISITNKDYMAITNNISIDKQREIFKEINSSLYHDIWYEGDAKAYKSFKGKKFDNPIKYKSISAKIDSKYIKLLQNLGKSNPKIASYVEKTQNTGDFPMLYNLFGMLIDTELNWTENLDDSKWRLIISIHLLTINEDQNRYISLKELSK